MTDTPPAASTAPAATAATPPPAPTPEAALVPPAVPEPKPLEFDAPSEAPVRFGADLEAALRERVAKREGKPGAILTLWGEDYHVRTDLDTAFLANAAGMEDNPFAIMDAVVALFMPESAIRLRTMLRDPTRERIIDQEFIIALMNQTIEKITGRPTSR